MADLDLDQVSARIRAGMAAYTVVGAVPVPAVACADDPGWVLSGAVEGAQVVHLPERAEIVRRLGEVTR